MRFAQYIMGGGGWPMVVAISSGSTLVDGLTLNLLVFFGRLAHLITLYHHGLDAFGPFRRLVMTEDLVTAGYNYVLQRFGTDLDCTTIWCALVLHRGACSPPSGPVCHRSVLSWQTSSPSSAVFSLSFATVAADTHVLMLLVGAMCASMLPGLLVHAALAAVSISSDGDSSSLPLHCIGWCLVLVALQLQSVLVALRRM